MGVGVVVGGAGDDARERGLSIQTDSGGVLGTVYCVSAARERSERLGAQTPTRTRHAATSRFALEEGGVRCQLVCVERVQGGS